MNCMKCGREIKPEQVFCEECLEVMERYPVKSDTVVLLPKRSVNNVRKVHQRRYTPEEQIAALEKRCRRLIAALVVALILLAGMTVASGIKVRELDMQRFIGKNYTSSDMTETTGANASR